MNKCIIKLDILTTTAFLIHFTRFHGLCPFTTSHIYVFRRPLVETYSKDAWFLSPNTAIIMFSLRRILGMFL